MTSPLLLVGLIAPKNPVVRYILQVFHRDPFRGLYHPNAFDLAILIPYFTILIILSVYGVHRYYLTYLYLKNRRNLPKPRETFQRLPRVTVQLPRSEEHTSELQSRGHLVCRLLLEKKKHGQCDAAHRHSERNLSIAAP